MVRGACRREQAQWRSFKCPCNQRAHNSFMRVFPFKFNPFSCGGSHSSYEERRSTSVFRTNNIYENANKSSYFVKLKAVICG